MFNLEIVNDGHLYVSQIDLEQIVSKPIERLLYSKYIDDRSVALDYFESVEINSEDHIDLNDLSWKIIENNPNFLEDEENSTKHFNINSPYKNLLITNIVLNSNKEGYEIPLWYRHKRESIKEVSIHYINNGDSLDVEEGFILSGGYLYTNYKNTFNNRNSNYRVYFVSGVTEDNTPFNELLNPIPAIKETGWEDVDLTTGEIKNPSYERITETLGEFSYTLHAVGDDCENENTSDKIYYKGKEDNFIRLLKPESFRLNNPWLLRVTNGAFFANGKRYWIPEYSKQPFDGRFGALRLFNKECIFVTESIIKTPLDKLVVEPESLMHISLFVYDENDNLIYAFTTDENLIGETYGSSEVVYEEGILSWDEEHGFIEINKSISASNTIRSNFYFNSDSLVLNHPENGFNINPYSNEELIYKKALFYLIPDRSPGLRSVFYFLLDEEDRILFSSNKIFKEIADDGSFNGETLIGENISVFREAYCTGYGNDKDYLELGEVTFKEDYYLDECLEMDIRSRGYLKDSEIKNYFNKQHKGLQSLLGYGEDGQVYQNNNLIYVKYPIDLLENYGGPYKEKDLKRYTKRKMRPGMDVVIEYYYPKSSLDINLQTGSTTINASWEGKGTYRILRSTHEFGQPIEIFTKHSETLESISYVDNNIISGKMYWYWVRINEYPVSNSYGVEAR